MPMLTRVLILFASLICLQGCAARHSPVGAWRGRMDIGGSDSRKHIPRRLRTNMEFTVLYVNENGTYKSSVMEGTWKQEGDVITLHNKTFMGNEVKGGDLGPGAALIPLQIAPSALQEFQFKLSKDGASMDQIDPDKSPMELSFTRI